MNIENYEMIGHISENEINSLWLNDLPDNSVCYVSSTKTKTRSNQKWLKQECIICPRGS